MFEKVITFIKASQAAQIAVALIAGMAIGALMYPTRHIEEKLNTTHQQEIEHLKAVQSSEMTAQKEQYSKLEQETKEYHKTTESKISSLTTQVTTLKSHQKTSSYKLVKPDGTIEERNFSESDVDESQSVVTSIQQEFKEKVDSIEKKWEQIHKERVTQIEKEFASKESDYQKTIDTLQKSKVEDVNKKSFGIEAGGLSNASYYGHITYDVFGPFFLGAQGQWGNSNAAGLGIGIRF